jgi:hypothetical protein
MASAVSWIEPGSRASDSASVRADTATAAPSAANLRAMAAPMPRLAPVTMATRPSSAPLMRAMYHKRRSMTSRTPYHRQR